MLVNLVGQLKRRRSLTLTRLLEKRDLFETLKNEPARALYESLSPDEQKVMQALAIYGKSVPEAALRHLFPELGIEQLLETLETSYAVQFSDTDPISYSLRPLDQSYAYAQISKERRQELHMGAAMYYGERFTPAASWRTLGIWSRR